MIAMPMFTLDAFFVTLSLLRGELWYFFQMAIAAGGSEVGQVFAAGRSLDPHSPPTPFGFVGKTIKLDAEDFIHIGQEVVKDYIKKPTAQLTSSIGAWRHTDHDMVCDTILQGRDTQLHTWR